MTEAATARDLAADLARALNPVSAFERVIGEPDDWQREILDGRPSRVLMNCCRQAGKSVTAAAAVVDELERPSSLVLLVAPSLRQSQELYRKARELHREAGGCRIVAESALRVELANGSRLVALPGSERTTRGFSAVDLLVADEAARVEDSLYRSVRPMLAVSGGRLIALSTPFGRRGFFFDAWRGDEQWSRVEVPATSCPRIPPDFLAAERVALGPRWFAQEYCCSFEDTAGAVFAYDDIAEAITGDVEPLWVPGVDARADDDDESASLWSKGGEVENR